MSSLPESVFIVSIVLIVVTTLAIALRVWDRVGTGRNFGWDDGKSSVATPLDRSTVFETDLSAIYRLNYLQLDTFHRCLCEYCCR